MRFILKVVPASFMILFLQLGAHAAENANPGLGALPFDAGEILVYDVSWSNTVNAGTMVMEVKKETTRNGRTLLHFVSRAHSSGLLATLHPMNYSAQSVFDPESMQSVSYSLRTSSGRRNKSRDIVFDSSRGTVTCSENGNPPETYPLIGRIQDALSSIYYLRSLKDFKKGSTASIEVYDNGKTWTEEISVLGTEKVRTGAGEFSTIKLSVNSKHEGMFMAKGKFLIWLTDDSRKLPVLMKHDLEIGSVMISLQEMKDGQAGRPETGNS